MTRHLLNQFPYGPENTTRFPPPVHYDIRDRGFNIARTNPRADPTRPPNRTDVVAHHSVVASAIQDRNSGGAPRRRIPVAVSFPSSLTPLLSGLLLIFYSRNNSVVGAANARSVVAATQETIAGARTASRRGLRKALVCFLGCNLNWRRTFRIIYS